MSRGADPSNSSREFASILAKQALKPRECQLQHRRSSAERSSAEYQVIAKVCGIKVSRRMQKT
jgi:hypothetical protein